MIRESPRTLLVGMLGGRARRGAIAGRVSARRAARSFLQASMTGLALCGAAAVGCVGQPPCYGSGPASTIDGRTGIPVAHPDALRLFAGSAPDRQCQLVVYEFQRFPYAVWLQESHDTAAGAAVSVAALTSAGEVASFSTPFETRWLNLLSSLCREAIRILKTSCPAIAPDGPFYFAAHYVLGKGYQTAYVVAPRKGSVGRAFVDTIEALRDYATAPQPFKLHQWERVQAAQRELKDALREHGG